ncbi:MAG TPA: triose-phosphate isomerase [Verrucomicrobiae bacterium]|nr:triose-phosphate isomerase [Verrucomicrobiae bacterium]
MTRARIVIGNWKMNPLTAAAATQLARAAGETAARSTVRVGVAPPALFIPAVSEALRDSKVAVYGQDVSWEAKGAFTGQIAAPMLTPVVTGVLVGHSEVRRYLGDDDERVAKKLIQALRAGLEAVLCVGEREDEYDAGTTEDVLAAQLAPALAALSAADADGRMSERFVIAYEPVWAIGTGRNATGATCAETVAAIRDSVVRFWPPRHASAAILYGGSVTPENIADLWSNGGIDGFLVGGASLDSSKFVAIYEQMRPA